MDLQIDRTDSKSVDSKLDTISCSIHKINQVLPQIFDRVNDSQLQQDSGLSLLQLKNAVLLSHNANLLHLIMAKLDGKLIEGSPVVDRLIQTRVLIEKMKPLETKLKYQIERLLKLASSNTSSYSASLNQIEKGGQDNALQFRPNLSAMMNHGDAGENDQQPREGGINQTTNKAKEQLTRNKIAKYVPPKVVPMHYNEGLQEKARKREKRELYEKYNSNVMRELREEFSEAPVERSEISGASAVMYKKVEKLLRERKAQEEEYMTRLPPIKKLKQMTEIRGLSDVDRMMGAIRALKGEGSKKKRGRAFSSCSKSKKFKKRFKKR